MKRGERVGKNYKEINHKEHKEHKDRERSAISAFFAVKLPFPINPWLPCASPRSTLSVGS